MLTKKCNRCKENKALTDFGARPDRPDGLKYLCKACECKARKANYNKNPEKYREVNRNLGSVPKSRFSRFKKRCKNDMKVMDLSFEEWYSLVIGKPCHYCSGKLETKGCGLDRKNNDLGYIRDNVVACCKECNRLKGPSLTYLEMLAVALALKTMRIK